MRLLGAAIASLMLHALFLQVPMRASQLGKSVFALPLIDTARETRWLSVILQTKDDTGKKAPVTEEKELEEKLHLSNAAEAIETEPNKPRLQSTQNAPERIGLPALAAPQTRYYIRDEVDRPARMIDNINEKDGPLDKALRDSNEHGVLVLELWINDRGWVEKTEVVETTLTDVTVEIIREHVEGARFLPARLEHRPVSCRITLEFQVREKPGKPAETAP